METGILHETLSHDECKRIQRVLQLFPVDTRNHPERLKNILKQLGWSLFKVTHSEDPVSYNGLNNFVKSKQAIESLFGIKNIKPLHITSIVQEYWKFLLPDGSLSDQKTDIFSLTSDSNVYLLEWRDSILKLYFRCGEEEIRNYHQFHNQIAKQEYIISHEGQIDNRVFHTIRVQLDPLLSDWVIGTESSSISVVPYSNHANLRQFNIQKNAPFLNMIMQEIQKRNWLTTFPETVDPMNVQFIWLDDWVLSLKITDLADDLVGFLYDQNLLSLRNKQSKLLQEFFKWILLRTLM